MTSPEVMEWLGRNENHMVVRVPVEDTFEHNGTMWVDLGPMADVVEAVMWAAVSKNKAVVLKKDGEDDGDGQE